MNSQRAFWISGAATFLVLILIGSALVARSEAPTTGPVTVSASPATETEALKNELAQAYADLDSAYRTIEQLQQKPASRKKHHREDHDDDDHEEHDD